LWSKTGAALSYCVADTWNQPEKPDMPSEAVQKTTMGTGDINKNILLLSRQLENVSVDFH